MYKNDNFAKWRYLQTIALQERDTYPGLSAIFRNTVNGDLCTIGREDLISHYQDDKQISADPDMAQAQEHLAQMNYDYFLDALLDPESSDYLYVQPIAPNIYRLSFQPLNPSHLRPAPHFFILSQREILRVMLDFNREIYALTNPADDSHRYNRAMHNIQSLVLLACPPASGPKVNPLWRP